MLDDGRFASLDVQYNRELDNKAKLLERQAMRNSLVVERAPHKNYDFLIHPASTNIPQMTKHGLALYNPARDH